MIILDVLTQADYNVKDACEKLISLGHEKKESILTPPKLKDREEKKEAESPKPSPAPTRPKNLSEEHKKKGIFFIDFRWNSKLNTIRYSKKIFV